jgi:hypothetical protein
LFEQKIEDKIRGSFTASPPSNANIYCINCHNPFLEKKERILCGQLKDKAWKWLSFSGAVVREKAMHPVSQKVVF